MTTIQAIAAFVAAASVLTVTPSLDTARVLRVAGRARLLSDCALENAIGRIGDHIVSRRG